MNEPSPQTETISEAVTSEEVQVFPDSDVPPTAALSLETPTTDDSEQKLPPVEERIVIPLEKDEEAPISSTLILLDTEEELEEGKEKRDSRDRQQENLKYCPPSASLSSLCSCVASLQEYVQQQCSAFLSKKRKCQTMDKEQKIPPIKTPTWELSLAPSACPEPWPPHSEVHQPHEKEQTSEKEPETGAVVPEVPQTAGKTEESISEPILLEPSQTTNLPKPSATESSFAKPTPVVEAPQLSSEEPAEEPGPVKSQDVLAEGRHIEPSASHSSSVHIQPSVSVPVDGASAAPTEDNTDVPQLEINPPVHIQDKTDQSSVPTSSIDLEHLTEPPVVPESGPASTDVPHPAIDTVTEPEPAASQAETKMEDLAEDVSTSSGGNGQLFRPSSPTPPSATSPSLSDIYAEPFNGTEQNQVHGSSQKESVFMRLNNRIKALEVNMSLSGRYLEQLSQR